jgi:hypothetical protein
MGHCPRKSSKVMAHLGKGLFNVAVREAILIPNTDRNCDSLKTPPFRVLRPVIVLPRRNCEICPIEILPYRLLDGLSPSYLKTAKLGFEVARTG